MACDVSVPSFVREEGKMEVIEKYEALMQSTLGEESLYTRSKETIFHLFDKLNVTDNQKAEIVAQNITQLATQLSMSAMQSAVMWAKEERDAPYQLALLKAQAENGLATTVKTKEEICLIEKQIEQMCAQTEATLAGSIRENGRVETYVQEDGGDTCKPNTLENEGLKYHQAKQVEADTYKIQSDSYRKSGVVAIGVDTQDNVVKGLTGTTHENVGEIAGYTAQQSANAERQIIAYEDSKRNHAANSTASMMGQMLSAEVSPAEVDVDRWREAVDFLNTSHTSTDGA